MPFLVKSKECDQCLFGDNKVVSNKRKSEILRECTKSDTYFIYHKSQGNDKVCCNGFYERVGWKVNLIRIARRLGAVKFVD